MNRENIIVKEAYQSPVARITILPMTLNFLDNGFSGELELDIDLDDIEDAGEL